VQKTIAGKFVTISGESWLKVSYNSSGIIEEVLPFDRSSLSGIDYYYGDECLIYPGFMDIHVHARDDISHKYCYKEDFNTISQAAINGGVTFICDMPNNPIPPVDDDSYLNKLMLTKNSNIPVLLYAGISEVSKPLSFPVPYKIFLGNSVGNLKWLNLDSLERALERYRGNFVSFHCEDSNILANSINGRTHNEKRPLVAEEQAIDYAIKVIAKYDLNGIICHCSSKGGLKKILKAKKCGINIQVEVTPHHLYFFNEDLNDREKLMLQTNPPIRDLVDRNYLLEKVKDGEIDFLATDHAPHTLAEKIQGISGVTGLDTYGFFVSRLLNDFGVSSEIIARMCSYNPAQFVNNFISDKTIKIKNFNYNCRGFGNIEKGYAASFTVLDLSTIHQVSRDNIFTKVKHTPFDGCSFSGAVKDIFVMGNIF